MSDNVGPSDLGAFVQKLHAQSSGILARFSKIDAASTDQRSSISRNLTEHQQPSERHDVIQSLPINAHEFVSNHVDTINNPHNHNDEPIFNSNMSNSPLTFNADTNKYAVLQNGISANSIPTKNLADNPQENLSSNNQETSEFLSAQQQQHSINPSVVSFDDLAREAFRQDSRPPFGRMKSNSVFSTASHVSLTPPVQLKPNSISKGFNPSYEAGKDLFTTSGVPRPLPFRQINVDDGYGLSSDAIQESTLPRQQQQQQLLNFKKASFIKEISPYSAPMREMMAKSLNGQNKHVPSPKKKKLKKSNSRSRSPSNKNSPAGHNTSNSPFPSQQSGLSNSPSSPQLLADLATKAAALRVRAVKQDGQVKLGQLAYDTLVQEQRRRIALANKIIHNNNNPIGSLDTYFTPNRRAPHSNAASPTFADDEGLNVTPSVRLTLNLLEKEAMNAAAIMKLPLDNPSSQDINTSLDVDEGPIADHPFDVGSGVYLELKTAFDSLLTSASQMRRKIQDLEMKLAKEKNDKFVEAERIIARCHVLEDRLKESHAAKLRVERKLKQTEDGHVRCLRTIQSIGGIENISSLDDGGRCGCTHVITSTAWQDRKFVIMDERSWHSIVRALDPLLSNVGKCQDVERCDFNKKNFEKKNPGHSTILKDNFISENNDGNGKQNSSPTSFINNALQETSFNLVNTNNSVHNSTSSHHATAVTASSNDNDAKNAFMHSNVHHVPNPILMIKAPALKQPSNEPLPKMNFNSPDYSQSKFQTEEISSVISNEHDDANKLIQNPVPNSAAQVERKILIHLADKSVEEDDNVFEEGKNHDTAACDTHLFSLDKKPLAIFSGEV